MMNVEWRIAARGNSPAAEARSEAGDLSSSIIQALTG